MRAATRLLASVKPPRFLEAGTPTGLTGLFTHASPRSTLIFLYKSTLDKLKQFPESSVYRQSTEALTKHRLKIIESAKPDGYDAWEQRMRKAVEANPDVFKSGSPLVYELSDKSRFVTATIREEIDEREEEWDGEAYQAPQLEGPRTAFERKNQAAQIGADKEDAGRPDIQYELEPEPPLSTQQVAEIENQIGAGLLEEVVQVAEGELHLVGKMADAKIWEELAEKPAEGQWTYFERNTHMSKS